MKKKLKEVIERCIDYTLYMEELSFTKEERKILINYVRNKK